MPTVAVLPFFRIGASPLALEIMRIYNAGSSVYASAYTDTNGTIPMGNSDLVPIQADAYGLFPVVFLPVGAAYDIKYYSVDLVPRDTYQGIRVLGANGTVGDVDMVKISSTDTNGGYLGSKLLNSSTITWQTVNVGGFEQLQAVVDPTALHDYRIKTDADDPTPDYLTNKLLPGRYIDLVVDETTHRLKADFTGPSYVPVDGGAYNGSVYFAAGASMGGLLAAQAITGTSLTLSGAAAVAGTLTAGAVETTSLLASTVAITGLAGGTQSYVGVNTDGSLFRMPDPAAKVKYNAADTIPGYLGTKIVAGTGITINTTVDGVDGTVMHINSAAAGSVGKVKVDAADTVAGYLGTKIVSGVGIVLRETTGVDGKVLHIDLDIDSLYTANGKAKSEAVAVSGSGLFNFAHVDLQPGYYHLSAQMYVEATVSGATLELECNASDETYTFATDLYTGYAKASTGTAQRLAAVVADNKIRLTAPGSIYLVGRLVGSYSAGTAWGHISATRIA